MVASIRSTSASSYAYPYPSPSISRPSGVQAGDVLLCIHSCDEGSLSDMSISGSGWQTIASRSGDRFIGPYGGTKIYRKIATSSEPSSYQLTQHPDTDSTVVVLAVKGGSANGIVVAQSGDTAFPPFYTVRDVSTPGVTPPSGSGLEVRVAIAHELSSTTSWTTPSGYTSAATVSSRTYVSATVATRTLVTSTSVGTVAFRSSSDMYGAHGFTLIVPSGEENTPTPPSFPAFTPAKGSGLYRYTVHDLITGAYKADIFPTGVSFDRRIGEPGTFSATLPVPNQQVADQVSKIIPRSASTLSSGPGRIVVHVWRAGALWGIYWITAAMIQRSRRGGISIQLRGSTLDAYLHQVPIESDLEFTGDSIDNARSLLTDMMSLSGADIGLSLQSGSSGDSGTLSVKADDRTTYGNALNAYAESYPGFEYVVTPTVSGGVIERRWEWGAPRIERDKEHVFVESPTGGDILEWGEEIDALRGATRLQVRGGTPEVTDATDGSKPVISDWVSAGDHMSAGWPRYGQVVDHPGESLDKGELDAYASRWIAALPGAVRVYSATVALGANPTISPSSLGDYVRRLMVNEWYPRVDGGAGFDQAQRLIGIAITPVSRDTGREEAQLILEEASI